MIAVFLHFQSKFRNPDSQIEKPATPQCRVSNFELNFPAPQYQKTENSGQKTNRPDTHRLIHRAMLYALCPIPDN